MRIWVIGMMVLGLSGCITPHQELNGKWTKLAKVEERSALGTNQGFSRLERCDGPAEKKPWYKFYFENDFTNCIYLTKADQSEYEHASSRGAGPEIIGAAILGSSIGAGAAVSAGANAAATTTTSVTNRIVAPRPHRR